MPNTFIDDLLMERRARRFKNLKHSIGISWPASKPPDHLQWCREQWPDGYLKTWAYVTSEPALGDKMPSWYVDSTYYFLEEEDATLFRMTWL